MVVEKAMVQQRDTWMSSDLLRELHSKEEKIDQMESWRSSQRNMRSLWCQSRNKKKSMSE